MSFEAACEALPRGTRVGIVHDWLNGMRGGEKVLEVILEIFPGSPIFTLFYQPEKVSDAINSHPVRASCLNKIPGSKKFYRFALPLLPGVMRNPKFHDIDLLVSTSACVAKGAIPPPGTPHICYCHAPMRYVWEQFDDYFGPGKSNWPVRLLMKAFRGPLKSWDKNTSDRVTHFLCNARNISLKINRYYNRESHVVPPPVDMDRFRPRIETPGATPPNRWLVVSALVPYKRVDLAIKAVARRNEQLIISGRGPEEQRLRQLATNLGAKVEFLGWVEEDEVLADLYATSRGLIFPGEEDFGITPLESMASGRPVIAYARGGALETVIDGQTGVFFEEQTVEALVEAMDVAGAKTWDAGILRARAEEFSRDICRLRLARYFAWLFAQSNGRISN